MEIKDKVVVYLGDTTSSPLQLHLMLKSLSNFMGVPLRSVSVNSFCKLSYSTLNMQCQSMTPSHLYFKVIFRFECFPL